MTAAPAATHGGTILLDDINRRLSACVDELARRTLNIAQSVDADVARQVSTGIRNARSPREKLVYLQDSALPAMGGLPSDGRSPQQRQNIGTLVDQALPVADVVAAFDEEDDVAELDKAIRKLEDALGIGRGAGSTVRGTRR